MLTLLLLAAAALAQDFDVARSVDTELVHPAFGPDSGATVEGIRGGEPWTLAGGLAWQHERSPLQAWIDGEPAGDAIAWRESLAIGLGLALSERTRVLARGSGYLQEGGDLSEVAPARRLALGDLGLAVQSAWWQRPRVALGPALGLWLPVGTAESWVSERQIRTSPAVRVALGGERLALLGEVGLALRVPVDSGADFYAAPEITTGAALVLGARPWLAGLAEFTSRHGLTGLPGSGAEHPAGVLGGLRLRVPRAGRLDLLAGTGLGHGYGTADVRLLATLAGHTPPLRRPPRPAPVVAAPAPRPLAPIAPTLPALQPAPQAVVEHGELRLAAALAFEPGGAVLRPESEPVLAAVVEVLQRYPQLELVVVEGHASGAGSPRADFDLSAERARTIFERLMAASVRPTRLAWRGLGAADPSGQAGADGVDFEIARLRPPQEPAIADDGSPVVLPWNGETVPPPALGDGLLSAAGDPILRRVTRTAEGETLPSGESFREALDGDDEEETP